VREQSSTKTSQESNSLLKPSVSLRQQVASTGSRGRESHCATLSEKAAHLRALTEEEYATLLRWAKIAANKFRGKVNDGDGEDLLHHAILRAMRAPRKWQPQNVDFLRFVGGCIRSISYSWHRRAKRSESVDMLISPISQHMQVESSITLDWARRCLRQRVDAVNVFDLMRQGCTRAEIQRRLGINKAIYDAAYKWMLRTWRRAVRHRGGQAACPGQAFLTGTTESFVRRVSKPVRRAN
jgi:DNA-directed RNA polymerase specialized sigma24 family protein